MSSLIDYEDMTCKYCGASGSLVSDGDFDVECTSCGSVYSLVEDEDEDEDETKEDFEDDDCDL